MYQCNCGKLFDHHMERTMHLAECPLKEVAELRIENINLRAKLSKGVKVYDHGNGLMGTQDPRQFSDYIPTFTGIFIKDDEPQIAENSEGNDK